MGIVGWIRWGWRQLTSMRVALILLFLLALASIPGSLFPQRGINPTKVQQYLALLRQPIRLIASLDDSETGVDMKNLLETIVGLSDKVSLMRF